MKKQIYLVDVSSMYFRAFYAIRELSNSKGLPTNALYGFMSMTIKLMRDEHPDMMVYCFDSREPSFRKEIYSEYKANRSEMPEQLIPQVPYIRKITDVLGIPAVQAPGYEADDVIGTIACLARDAGYDVSIVSGDKDFAQMVGPRISIYDTSKDVRLGESEVVEKWGVKPEQFVDYLALVGDSSDNIPGVKGIGPKGAQKLLADYGTLDGIYAHVEEISAASLKKKLIESREMAYISKQLSQIHHHVPLNWNLEDGKLRAIDVGEARSLLRELEFKGLETKLFGAEGGGAETSGHTVSGHANVGASGARSGKAFGRSAGASTGEAASGRGGPGAAIVTPPVLNIPNHAAQFFSAPVKQVPVGAEAAGTAVYIQDFERLQEVAEGTLLWGAADSRGLLLGSATELFFFESELFRAGKILNVKNIEWSGWDLKTIFHALALSPEKPHVVRSDLMLAHYLLQSTEQKSFREAYQRFYSLEIEEFPTPQKWFDLLREFAVDVDTRLKELEMDQLYQKIELPLVDVLFGMERRGIHLDLEVLKAQRTLLDEDVKRLEKEVVEEVGEPFSLASPKQLSHILFEKLKMPALKKTKTGFSTDSDVLEKLAIDYPICKKIIEYRELAKLKSTYVDALPLLVDKLDDRLHTTFRQAVATTGRLSSTNPNLQNIPIRTVRGNAIRQAFVARSGSSIISADYSQIELRLLAHISGDENMIRAFENDLDIHAATAAEVFNVPLTEVTTAMRGIAKGVNFGIAYGISAFGLSENLGIPRGEAQDIISRYFGKFPGVREFMDRTIEQATEQGYIATLFGRRRYLPELASKNNTIKKFGERAAINAPIQGTAADLVKMAMVEAAQIPELRAHLLLQVHDELIFEVPHARVALIEEQVRAIMVNIAKLKVPLKVNVKSGPNWFEAH